MGSARKQVCVCVFVLFAAGLVRGRMDGFATLTYFSQDGFRDHSVQSTNRFFGNFGWRLNGDRETRSRPALAPGLQLEPLLLLGRSRVRR